MVYCTIFFSMIYCEKRPRDHGGNPTWKNAAKHLDRRARRLQDAGRPPTGRAPASHPLPPPASCKQQAAQQGGARRGPKGAGSPGQPPSGSGEWGPRLALSRAPGSHAGTAPEERLGWQGPAPEPQAAPGPPTWLNRMDPSIPHGQSRGFLGPKCLREKGQECGARGPEGGKEEGRKGGMPPGQHLWHRGALAEGKQGCGTVQLAGD